MLALGLFAPPVCAYETFKVGVSVGLTGYAAAVDRAWRDGLEIAVDYANAKGGVIGRKIQLVAVFAPDWLQTERQDHET
jgi:ABC-type branched-subunit amino acid transport system substrate-binding protein